MLYSIICLSFTFRADAECPSNAKIYYIEPNKGRVKRKVYDVLQVIAGLQTRLRRKDHKSSLQIPDVAGNEEEGKVVYDGIHLFSTPRD